MKRWKRILLVLVGGLVLLTAGLGLGGLAIDPGIELGVERRVSPSREVLFPFLDSATGIDAWWAVAQGAEKKMAVKKKAGPDQGAGLVVTFEADEHVMETWTVKNAEPPNRVVYDVDFAGMMTVERTLTLSSDGSGTLVSWRETGRLENPYMRWMKVLMPAENVTKNFDMAIGALEKAAAK